MKWLRDQREKTGMTQKQVATVAEIARASYSNIENGERKPSVETAKRIADVLEFDWTWFFSNEPSCKDEGT